jgi:CspA family cold shock protein
MHTGTVRWFSYSKGCGFIIPDDGSSDVYAHFSKLIEAGVEALAPQQRVRYQVRIGPNGPLASDIRTLN